MAKTKTSEPAGPSTGKELRARVVPLYKKKPQKKTFFSRFFGRG